MIENQQENTKKKPVFGWLDIEKMLVKRAVNRLQNGRTEGISKSVFSQ